MHVRYIEVVYHSFCLAEAAMRFHRAISASVTLSFVLVARPAVAANISDFVNYSYSDSSSFALQGLLHVPAEYASDPTTLRPLILFFHGSGESGTNNRSQINGNIDNLLAAAKTRGAFLYAPQTSIGWENPILLTDAMTMIDRAIADRSVDPKRIYVTGLSLGGGAVWNFLNLFPDRVAASVPISAVYPSASFVSANIVNEPIWAFASRSDTTVPITVTRSVINSLLTQAGQPLPTYTNGNFAPDQHLDFPPLDLHYSDIRGGHGIWPTVYNTPAMYDWMFAHGAAVPEPSSLMLALTGLAVFSRMATRYRSRCAWCG
jgi:predicted peptidase